MVDSDLIREFLAESAENLNQLDRDLVLLEQDPAGGAPEGVARIFRTIHTIKGNCGFFDFPQLSAVTHAGETLLGRLRDGQLSFDLEVTGALLALVDAVRATLAQIERTGTEGDLDHARLIDRLTRLASGPCRAPGTEAAPPEEQPNRDTPVGPSSVLAQPQPLGPTEEGTIRG
jgi:two-component system chemotaxis sensor kinase CheA